MGRTLASPFTNLGRRGAAASICRNDTAVVRAEDVAFALGALQIRQYDPVGNLRKAGE